MCGRFIIFDETEDQELKNIINEVNRKYKNPSDYLSKEIFPADTVPVITANEGTKEINLFKWGFPNYKQN